MDQNQIDKLQEQLRSKTEAAADRAKAEIEAAEEEFQKGIEAEKNRSTNQQGGWL